MLNQFVKDVQMYAPAKNKLCGELAQIVLLVFGKTFKVYTIMSSLLLSTGFAWISALQLLLIAGQRSVQWH